MINNLTVPFCHLHADGANEIHVLTVERASRFECEKGMVRSAGDISAADQFEMLLAGIQADDVSQFNARAVELAQEIMRRPMLWRARVTDVHTKHFEVRYFVWTPRSGNEELARTACQVLSVAWSEASTLLGVRPRRVAASRAGIAADVWIQVALRFGVAVELCEGRPDDLPDSPSSAWWERNFESSRDLRNWMSVERLNVLASEAAGMHCHSRP